MPRLSTYAYTTRTINGWFGDELHYMVEGRTVGAILQRASISNSTKRNYTYERRNNRSRYYSSRGQKKYFVVVPNLPIMDGPYYYDEAIRTIERIITENA